MISLVCISVIILTVVLRFLVMDLQRQIMELENKLDEFIRENIV